MPEIILIVKIPQIDLFQWFYIIQFFNKFEDFRRIRPLMKRNLKNSWLINKLPLPNFDNFMSEMDSSVNKFIRVWRGFKESGSDHIILCQNVDFRSIWNPRIPGNVLTLWISIFLKSIFWKIILYKGWLSTSFWLKNYDYIHLMFIPPNIVIIVFLWYVILDKNKGCITNLTTLN